MSVPIDARVVLDDDDTTSRAWSTHAVPDRLPPDEVHVWRFDLDGEGLRGQEALLSEDEIARAVRFQSSRDRARYVAGRVFMRRILSRYVGTSPQSLAFSYNRYGKPVLAGVHALFGSPADDAPKYALAFNASASEGVALLAVRAVPVELEPRAATEESVGVDVEAVRPSSPAMQEVLGTFSAVEQQELTALDEPARIQRAFQFWVQKEAVIKSLGLGMGGAFESLSMHGLSGGAAAQEGAPAFRTVEVEQAPMRTVLVCLLPPPHPEFVAALALRHPCTVVRCWSVAQTLD